MTSRAWLVPFVSFWVTMLAVPLMGYGITLACFGQSFAFVPLLGPGWGVAGLLAAATVGFLSEFIVESPSLAGLDPRTRIRLAILAMPIVCTNFIYLGLRFFDWASNQPFLG